MLRTTTMLSVRRSTRRSRRRHLSKSHPRPSRHGDQRAAWAALPIQVRGIITARERERDTALKRKFQELHELKLRLLSGADKPVQTNEKDYQHVSTSQV
jgi:hypothetical protein